MTKIPWFIPLPLLFLPTMAGQHQYGAEVLYSALLTLGLIAALFAFKRRNSLSAQMAQSYWIQIKNGWHRLLAMKNDEGQSRNLLIAFAVALALLLLTAPAIGIPVSLLAVHFILAEA